VGVGVTLITDAQAALFVGGADLVLLGADALSTRGAVNKAGSHLLALAARAAGESRVQQTKKITKRNVFLTRLSNPHVLVTTRGRWVMQQCSHVHACLECALGSEPKMWLLSSGARSLSLV